MNNQQRINFIKENERIILELDNQLVIVCKSSNKNEKETEEFKSPETAEDYFYYLKSDFESKGFIGQLEEKEDNYIEEIELLETKELKKNPNQGSVPGKLADKVIEQIRRLGGDVYPENAGKVIVDGFRAPDAISLWYTHTIPNKEYMTDECGNNSHWVWMMSFCWAQSCEEFSAIDKDDKVLSMIGMADRGNYILALDLNDQDPSDPLIYRFDHYDPEQSIGDGAKLSAFLTDLVPEE